ncbi:MAG: hypothetical protein ABJC61_00945 [Acidobacteriota bacterium]
MSTEDLKGHGRFWPLAGALDRREDFGHYGSLPFAMVARQFPDRACENISGYHEKKAEGEDHPER